jgi:hypothetical protein
VLLDAAASLGWAFFGAALFGDTPLLAAEVAFFTAMPTPSRWHSIVPRKHEHVA